MEAEWVRDRCLTKAAIGMLAATVVFAAAMLSASARADTIIVPHASEPHKVELHAPSAPAPSAAPPPQPSVAPAPSSPTTSSPPTAPSLGDNPEDNLPGWEVPPGRNDVPRPTGPDYTDPACIGDCLSDWAIYLDQRAQVVFLNGDPEDANALKELRAEVNMMIREEQVQAAGEGDGGELGMPGDSDGSESDGSDVPTGTVEVIFGPVVPNLDPVDLGTWDLGGVVSAAQETSFVWLAEAIHGVMNGPSTQACRNGVSPDDEVPICPN